MPIDVHAHFVPAHVIQELHAHPKSFSEIAIEIHNNEAASLKFPGEHWTRPLSRTLTDVTDRETWMETQGVTQQCLAGWVDLFGYGLSPAQGGDWCRLLNDALSSSILGNTHFMGVAAVPLQDPKLAAQELSRAVAELGFPAVMISTQVAGIELDDRRFDPFWALASEARVPILLHPGYAGSEERLESYGLANAVGRASETTLAITRMIFGGVFERYPDLIVVLVHGGGFLPYQIGRLQRSYELGQFEKSAGREPQQVISKLYYDSVVFQPETLCFLVKQVGAMQVVLGSDYPFPIGDLNPLKIVREAKLEQETKEAILDHTARKLLEQVRRSRS